MSGKDNQDSIGRERRRMERRDFLYLAASSALAASGMLGCGASSSTGNDDGNNNGNNNGNTGGFTPAQRSASIQAVLDKVNAIASQPRETRKATMLAYLRSQPGIIGSGMNTDGVWGIYRDGVPLMILDNREGEDEPPDDAPLPELTAGPEVPTSISARFINTMGPAFPNVTTRFTPLLAAKGYALVPDPGKIETLATAAGDGVFCLNGHGGIVTIPDVDSSGNVQVDASGNATGLRSAYAIWTSSPYDPSNPNEYRTSILAGEVGIGIAAYSYVIVNGNLVDVDAAHYWITPQFVRNRMQAFGENSLVWFNTCSSDAPDSADLVAECLGKKAGLYVGWSNPTSAGAIIPAGRFILDRLLGSNTTNPKENPAQRPFNYEEVWDDLRKHGLNSYPVAPKDPSDLRTTEIVYTPGASRFGLLAPSLKEVFISEVTDQAILEGSFGTPPANQRAVLIGGLEAAVDSWGEEEIVCKLPRTGTGSAGDVVVSVRGHDSNIRRITEWNIPLRYSFKNPDKPGLEVAGEGFVRFRADIGEFREHAHDAPSRRIRAAVATRDSILPLMASGRFTPPGACPTEWSGQQDFTPVGYGPLTYGMVVRFKVDPDAGTGAIGLGLQASGPPPFLDLECSPPGELFMVSFGDLYGPDDFPSPDEDFPLTIPLFAIQLDFGDPNTTDYHIPNGFVLDFTTGTTRVEWGPCVPSFPPDRTAARAPISG